ncbi:hypothetical protein ACQKQC_16140 [Vibrio fortis]|uniref:hypothetical protein n=1 Tax=Vibrio fortis TaxID=212667 RepID=UPI0040695118
MKFKKRGALPPSEQAKRSISLPSSTQIVPYVKSNGVGAILAVDDSGTHYDVTIANHVPELDEKFDTSISTIYKRQSIQVQIPIDAEEVDFGLEYHISPLLNELRSGFKSVGGLDVLDMKAVCQKLVDSDDFKVTSCVELNPHLKQVNAKVSSYYATKLKKGGKRSGGERKAAKVKEMIGFGTEVIPAKFGTVLKTEADYGTSKKGILAEVSRVYSRGGTNTLYVSFAFPNTKNPERFPNFKTFRFASAKYSVPDSEFDMETALANIQGKVEKVFKGSLTAQGFMERVAKPFSDDGQRGFDELLKEAFGEQFVEIHKEPAARLTDYPVCYALEALVGMGYLSEPETSVDSPKTGQDLFVFGNTKIVATGKDAYQTNTWSDHAPSQWILKTDAANVNGSTASIAGYLMEMGHLKVSELQSKFADKPNSFKEIEKELNRQIIDYVKKNNMDLVLDGQVVRGSITPRLPARMGSRMKRFSIEEYMAGRGITQKVIDKVMASGKVYDSVAANGSVGVSFDCGTCVQRFVPGQNGVVKLFDNGAVTKGAVQSIKGEYVKNIVLGEATMDMYAFLSLVDLAGGDIEEYTVASLLSAGYFDAWFDAHFGIKLPDESSPLGYLVDKETVILPDPDVAPKADAILKSANNSYPERVVYVCDGSDTSRKKKELVDLLVSSSSTDIDVEVITNKNREFVVKDFDKVVAFDKTNIDSTLRENGLGIGPHSRTFVNLKSIETITPIESEEHKIAAAMRVRRVVGENTKFILALDNDTAGLSKAVPVYNMLNQIGVPVGVTMVPYLGMKSPEFDTQSVLATVKSGMDLHQLPFSEDVLSNDVNHILKIALARGGDEGKRFAQTFVAQANDNPEVVNQKFSIAETITSALVEKKILMRDERHPEVYKMAKQLESILKDRNNDRSEVANLKSKIENYLSQLPDVERNHILAVDRFSDFRPTSAPHNKPRMRP